MEQRFRLMPGRLMDQVREVLRYHHDSLGTEKTYISLMLKYIRFNNRRHPWDMDRSQIERFLNHPISKKISRFARNDGAKLHGLLAAPQHPARLAI